MWVNYKYGAKHLIVNEGFLSKYNNFKKIKKNVLLKIFSN